MSRSRRLRAPALAVTALLGGVGAARAEEPSKPTPEGRPPAVAEPPGLAERVENAIAGGVAWLKGEQDGQGSWGDLAQPGVLTYNGNTEGYDDPVGPTALALYALLKCGVPVSDAVVKRGFAWLKKNHPKGGNAYEVSALLLAVTATADPFREAEAGGDQPETRLTERWRAWARELTKELIRRQGPRGWRYWGKHDTNAGGPQDVSSTQFALLALLAADRCGISVPPQAWSGALGWTRTQQEPEGPAHPRAVHAPGVAGDLAATPVNDRARGFAYILGTAPTTAGKRATGAMTACGVATLFMARHALSTRHPKWWAEFNGEAVQQSIHDGLAWMDLHWNAFENPESSSWHIYYLYCVERALDLAGVHRVGKHLWYAEMAEQLLKRQAKDGSWNSRSASADSPVLDTSFALLFLQRATRGGIPFPSVTGTSQTGGDGK